MRVLNVVPDLSRRSGGIPVFVVESARALQQLGVDVTVIATDLSGPTSAKTWNPAEAADLVPGADLVDHQLFPSRRLQRVAYSHGLGEYLHAEAPAFDIVHNHALYLWPLHQVHAACRAAGKPYVVSPHGSLDPFLRRRHRARKAVVTALWQRSALRDSRALHATTEAELNGMSDVAPKVDRFVVPAGIWWDAFQPRGDGKRFRMRYLDGFDGPVVLNHGRISFKKGLDILVRSFAVSEQALPGAKLVIIGNDDEGLVSQLRSLATKLGVADNVTFTGAIHGSERLDALAAATVWVLPSHTENFGIAAVEAMAAGVPTIISSEVNIASDAAARGATEVVAPSSKDVAEALLRLLRDGDARIRLSAEGRVFARSYDWASVATKLEAMYRTVASAS